MTEDRSKLKVDLLQQKLSETMTESDLARCLHFILSEMARKYKKTIEEVSDSFVKLSGDLDALKSLLSQKSLIQANGSGPSP